jgi:hypothetical protein
MIPGADPGFQARRGGALKQIAPSGGRREYFGGISCKKSRFYAKKLYFFQLRREARKYLVYFVWKITILRQKIIFFPIAEGGAKIFGVFRVKNHDFTPKNHIFFQFRGGGRRVRPPGFNHWFIKECHHSLHNENFPRFFRNPFWQ